MSYISINFELYKEDEAKISITDLALQRGYGIFDFLKTINGKAIFIEDHFNRFYNSAKALNLQIDFSKDVLLNEIHALMAKNNMPNSGIKFILTGGFSIDGYTIGKPNLIITQVPFEFDESSYSKGMRLMTYHHQRQLAKIKTIDYLQAILLQTTIKEQLADDVLYHDNGLVRECPRANFFMIKDKTIITPKTAVLEGITRSKILNLKLDGYAILAKDFTLDELKIADEAFITSSTKNVMPVLNIDRFEIGNGKPGPVTKLINDKFAALLNYISE